MAQKRGEPKPATQMIGFQLRLKEELRARIEDAAKKSGRSMNAEMVSRLERSMHLDDQLAGPLQPFLIAIAFEAMRIEKRTGRSPTEDRAAAYALAKRAHDIIEGAVPLLNIEEVAELVGKARAVWNGIERKIGFLEDAGAVATIEPGKRPYTLNALRDYSFTSPEKTVLPPSSDAVPLPLTFPELVGHLVSMDKRLTIDLDQSPHTWMLARDGKNPSNDEAPAVSATIESMKALFVEFAEIMEELDIAEAAEKAAEREGEQIAASLDEVQPWRSASND